MNRKFVRGDRDLYDVLKQADGEELELLVQVMGRKSSCKLPKDCRDVDLIVNEFQLMGGNSFANLKRNHGVAYTEIVDDVARRVKARTRVMDPVADKEWKIVEQLVTEIERNMSPAERKEFFEEIRKQTGVQVDHDLKELFNRQVAFHVFRLVLLRFLVGFVLAKLGLLALGVVGIAGRFLSLAAGPVGWIAGGAWAAVDLAGPAYSVTIPGVMVVAMVRARLAADVEGAKGRKPAKAEKPTKAKKTAKRKKAPKPKKAAKAQGKKSSKKRARKSPKKSPKKPARK